MKFCTHTLKKGHFSPLLKNMRFLEMIKKKLLTNFKCQLSSPNPWKCVIQRLTVSYQQKQVGETITVGI